MQKLLLLLLLSICTVSTAVDKNAIKKTIIIRQINGKTVITGPDEPECKTLKESKKGNEQTINIEIKITTTGA